MGKFKGLFSKKVKKRQRKTRKNRTIKWQSIEKCWAKQNE